MVNLIPINIHQNQSKMKSSFKYVSILILFLMLSCQKESIIRFGFDTDFGRNSHGLSIMHVGKQVKRISLEGELFVSEGGVLLELINPNRETVFTIQPQSPENLYLDESFQAVSGNWKLKYRSIEGSGTITLHLNAVN